MDRLKIMTNELAHGIARLVLAGVNREYPNQPGHVLMSPADARLPRTLHPAFFGCYDWHSAVHSHWTMLKLLEQETTGQDRPEMLDAMAAHLSADAIQAEIAYFREPGRAAFERPYGWAWVWKLSADLARSPLLEARTWHANIRPLADLLADRFSDWLARQHYPCRAGTHGNTAFAMAFGLDFAQTCSAPGFAAAMGDAGSRLFAGDQGFTFRMEPSGNDFISPMLAEISLMGRLLPSTEWQAWLTGLLPCEEELFALSPVRVTDRLDPQGVHLDGLNLSRAYHLASIAGFMPPGPMRQQIGASADAHWRSGTCHIFTGDFLGEHWLGSFAMLAALEMASNSIDCPDLPRR